MTSCTSDSSLKYLLWVALYRVSFHTRSIGFRCGLYGGRKNNRIDLRCLYNQGLRSFAWCQRALSRTRIILFLDLFRFTRRLRKDKKVTALKTEVIMLENLPSSEHTAPNTLTLFRVGASNTTGSVSSGGIHILHREPCCWKWHSSSNHSSVFFFFSNNFSFFICLFTGRVTLRNDWPGFSITKSEFMEDALALTNTYLNLIILLKVMAQQFAIPKILLIAELPWRFPKILFNFPAYFRRELRRSSGAWYILQSSKAMLIKSLYPLLDRAWAVPKPFSNIIAGMSGGNQQNAVKPVVISGIFRPYEFLFHRYAYILIGNNSKFSHVTSFERQRYSNLIMRNNLCRYV